MESASGGRSGSPVSKSSSSSLILVRLTPPFVKFQLLTIALVFVYFASYTYFTSTYFQWMPNAGNCAGEEFAAFAGMGIISSYLVLFISFYFATYKKDGKRPTGRKAARSLVDAKLPDVTAILDTKPTPSKKNGSATTTGTPSPRVTRSRKA